jgi:hypothetical protein
MKLGTYTFEIDPDQFTIPRPQKYSASVKTYFSVAFFSWGMSIIGQEILLEWDLMRCDQFNMLDAIFQADVQAEWDSQITPKIFHGPVANGPFVAGKTLTGNASGATATASKVLEAESYLEFAPIALNFQVGEVFHDDSAPQKSATITSIEKVPKYTVEVKTLDGKYVEPAGPQVAFRKEVKMILLIMGVA